MDLARRVALRRLMAVSALTNAVAAASFVCIVQVLAGRVSPVVLGLALGAATAIDALVSPVGGWLADRFDRPVVVMVGIGIQVVCFLGLAGLSHDTAALIALLCLAEVGESIAVPATATLAPTVFPPHLLGHANSRVRLMAAMGSSVGLAAVSGLFLVTDQVWLVFLLNAAVLVVAAANTIGLMRRFPPAARVIPRAASGSWRLAWRHPVIRLVTGYYLVSQVGAGTLWVGLPILAQHWQSGVFTYATLRFAGSIGELAGAWLAARFARGERLVRTIVGFTGLQAACIVAVGALPLPALAVGLYAVYAGCVTLTGVVVMTLVGTAVDNHLLGRASGLTDAAAIGGFAGGNLVGGPVVAWLGPLAAVLACGVGNVISAAILLGGRRSAHDRPDQAGS
jgi:MFS family permease